VVLFTRHGNLVNSKKSKWLQFRLYKPSQTTMWQNSCSHATT